MDKQHLGEGCQLTPTDLIATARSLAHGDTKGLPHQVCLRLAVDTTYYALFHALAGCCADALIGGSDSSRSQEAWHHVYRSLEHGYARRQCAHRDIGRFPAEIQDFANQFVQMQQERYCAYYSPDSRFYKDWVLQKIAEAEYQLHTFSKVPLRDRRAFAVHVLMPVGSD